MINYKFLISMQEKNLLKFAGVSALTVFLNSISAYNTEKNDQLNMLKLVVNYKAIIG